MGDVIIGFFIALLSGMGVGSAGLFVVWLCIVEGVPQLAAQGLNLYFFLFSSSASLLVHIRRRKILWGVLLFMLFFGTAGAITGTLLASFISGELLRRLFGAMLLFSGAGALIKSISAFRKKNGHRLK